MIKNLLKKRLGNEKGLTLIELLAVIVILAIVAAIAIPAIGNIINNSEIKAVKADALNILNASNIYMTENNEIQTITYTAPTTAGGTGSYAYTNSAGNAITPSDLFTNYIESLGAFSAVGFTISENAAGQLTITTAADIVAGSANIEFANATIDGIDANDANTDGTFVIVD